MRQKVTALRQNDSGRSGVNLDLPNAQRQLFTAQRDLAQARFLFMLSNLIRGVDALTVCPARLCPRFFRHSAPVLN